MEIFSFSSPSHAYFASPNCDERRRWRTYGDRPNGSTPAPSNIYQRISPYTAADLINVLWALITSNPNGWNEVISITKPGILPTDITNLTLNPPTSTICKLMKRGNNGTLIPIFHLTLTKLASNDTYLRKITFSISVMMTLLQTRSLDLHPGPS